MPKPIIAIDFDGTLIPSITDGTFREDETGQPFIGATEFIRALAQKYDVVIFSARATTFRGKNAILEWVRKNNLRGCIKDVTNEKKYSFWAYVDDRAITFNDPNDYVSIAESLGCSIEAPKDVTNLNLGFRDKDLTTKGL